MGVANLTNMSQAFKGTFNLVQTRHIMVFSSVVSKLLEIKQPHNKIALVREFTRAFDTCLEDALAGSSVKTMEQLPVLCSGLSGSHLKLQSVPQPDTTILYKLGGELLNPADTSATKTKMARVFARGLWQLKTPENLSVCVVLVAHSLT